MNQPPVFCPHPLAVEIARRFPGHWFFSNGPCYFSEPSVSISMPYTNDAEFCWRSVRVRWPTHRHPDAHSWRCTYIGEGGAYTTLVCETLDQLPHAIASCIVYRAIRGSGQCQHRLNENKRILTGHPGWLQSEIDRLIAKDNTQ